MCNFGVHPSIGNSISEKSRNNLGVSTTDYTNKHVNFVANYTNQLRNYSRKRP